MKYKKTFLRLLILSLYVSSSSIWGMDDFNKPNQSPSPDSLLNMSEDKKYDTDDQEDELAFLNQAIMAYRLRLPDESAHAEFTPIEGDVDSQTPHQHIYTPYRTQSASPWTVEMTGDSSSSSCVPKMGGLKRSPSGNFNTHAPHLTPPNIDISAEDPSDVPRSGITPPRLTPLPVAQNQSNYFYFTPSSIPLPLAAASSSSASSSSHAAHVPTNIVHNKPIEYDYQSWKSACNKLPSFTAVGSTWKNTALNWPEFQRVLTQFFTVNKQWYSQRSDFWMENQPRSDDSFFNIFAFPPPFNPFVQKMVVAPDTQVALRGDLHGDIHSLMAYIDFLQKEGHLDGFAIRDKNKFHMVFLGDYVDRGNYGLEVMYTLMRLKIVNPDNVTLVRGNHEDTMMCNKGGFRDEFEQKFGVHDPYRYSMTVRMYDFLPAALWLGSGSEQGKDFMQCCHGGMEVGFDPVPLLNSAQPIAFSWIEKLNRATEFEKLSLDEHGLDTLQKKRAFASKHKLYNIRNDSYGDIGFMWSDFQVIPRAIKHSDGTGQSLIFGSQRGKGIFEYSKVITQAILKHASRSPHKIRGVLRAHQHSNMMESSNNDPAHKTMDDMMESILDPRNVTNHKGLSKLWKDEQNDGQKDLWQNIVCTFLVAPDSGYSCKALTPEMNSSCLCEDSNSINGCKKNVPSLESPCKGSLFDFDAFAIMTTGPTFEQWKLKVHRNMLQNIIPEGGAATVN